MSSSKDKGTQFETAVTRYLQANGFPGAERRALSGSNDKGDILVAPGIIAECKNWASYSGADVKAWQKETSKETGNANASIGLLIIKRHRHNVAASWCWRFGGWGYWHAQLLEDAVSELRDMGWGDPW